MTSVTSGASATEPMSAPIPRKQLWISRLKLWLLRSLEITIPIVVVLALMEVALRVQGIGYGHSPLVGHPIFHHWHPPAYQMRAWGPHEQWGGFDIEFNADGFCMGSELPSADQPSIVFLGDSFTEGVQVREDQRFVNLVAAKLRLPGLNFGCSSFTPLLSQLQLEYFQNRVSPAAVVLQVCFNDIDDDIGYRAVAHRDASGRINAVPGAQTPWWVRLGRQSYLVRFVRQNWLALKLARASKARSGDGSGAALWKPTFTKSLNEWYTDEERAGIESSILAIRNWCQARHCPFLLMVIPDRGALHKGTEDFLAAHFKQFAKTHSLNYVDLLPGFRKESPADLFFPEDVHLTAKGHLVVSEALSSALTPLLHSKTASVGPPRSARH